MIGNEKTEIFSPPAQNFPHTLIPHARTWEWLMEPAGTCESGQEVPHADHAATPRKSPAANPRLWIPRKTASHSAAFLEAAQAVCPWTSHFISLPAANTPQLIQPQAPSRISHGPPSRAFILKCGICSHHGPLRASFSRLKI